MLFICFLIASLPVFAKRGNIQNKEDNFSVRVAVVDIQSILEGSVAIQNLRETVSRLNQKIQQDISKKEIEFKPLEENLIKERQSLSEVDFEKRVNEFNVKVSEVKKEIQARKTKLEQAHAEAMGMIHEMTITIITELAEKYDLNLVIPNTQILYARNNLNITAEVTFILNERLKNVTVNY
ncbi:OmpH family outer membrane protein [Rickettsia endosymbiont of Halotydeus destructor]|uniref:OmpH family outer membrane protein n=1 Tax=Rickettsia endosymbiont of Halotydeus destructor TaxID=2996754 RepID=UPI003BAE6F70